MTSPAKCGLAVMANDRVYDWFLPFLRSFRAHNPDMPGVVIPYHNDMKRTAAAAAEHGFEVAQYDFATIDRFARKLFPRNRYRRHKLRKLAVFDLPFETTIYLDIDTLVLANFDALAGVLAPGEAEFVYASLSPEWVYKPNYTDIPVLAGKPLFSDGFFVSSQRFLSSAQIMETIRENLSLYRALRRDDVYCQPAINFATHIRGLALQSVSAVTPDLSDVTFYEAEGIVADRNSYRDTEGRTLLFVHWAGAKSGDADADPRFGELWRRYREDS
ncbi:MAG: hypothetical protein P8Z76_15705 [Alphaproteobacteria bacterium]